MNAWIAAKTFVHCREIEAVISFEASIYTLTWTNIFEGSSLPQHPQPGGRLEYLLFAFSLTSLGFYAAQQRWKPSLSKLHCRCWEALSWTAFQTSSLFHFRLPFLNTASSASLFSPLLFWQPFLLVNSLFFCVIISSYFWGLASALGVECKRAAEYLTSAILIYTL